MNLWKTITVGCLVFSWVLVLALVCCLVFLVVRPSFCQGNVAAPLTTTTLVRADGEWQSSGLYIKKGQRVVVVAAGAWRHDGYDDVFYGPDGVGIYFDTAVMPAHKVGVLLGRVGGSAPFILGSSTVFVAEGDGFLQFSMNDDRGTYGNNLGEVRVQVLVNGR
jgi:hypothetical protein